MSDLASGADADYTVFRRTGDAAKGEFRCANCQYGVVISQTLPRCPMCGGEVWEPSDWHPFARSDEFVAATERVRRVGTETAASARDSFVESR